MAVCAALALALPAAAQDVKGEAIAKAIAALKTEKPSADEQKALQQVFAAHSAAVFKAANVTPSKEDLEKFKGNTVLTLQVLDIMTGGEKATLSKLTMDDLVAVCFVLMNKMKEMKATAKELGDEKWRNEKLIPAVIGELAKMSKGQEGGEKKPGGEKKKR
jgi:hypothetical protein